MKNDNGLSLKYRILRRLVKAANIKKRWTGMSAEALLENRRRQNAKNRIPALNDDAFKRECDDQRVIQYRHIPV